MALTNAERQKRHRDRQKEAAALARRLSPQQLADREAVIAGPLLPISAENGAPAFMGLSRHRWMSAPDEMVDHFDMREARDRWRAEWADRAKIHDDALARARSIVMEVGIKARRIWEKDGPIALCEAYDTDPRLRAQKGH